MSKNSQILKAVGGLEAAQGIVERAPKGATHYTNDAGHFEGCSQHYIVLSDLRTAITEQRIAESYNNHEKFQNLAESLREIGGQYQDENHLGRQAYETSAAYIDRELQELCGTPVAPSQTHAELVLHEQIKNLKSSRDFWRVMFCAAFICYGVAWWLV